MKTVHEDHIQWWWVTDHYDVHLSGIVIYEDAYYYAQLESEWGMWDEPVLYKLSPSGFMFLWRLHKWLFEKMVKETHSRSMAHLSYYRVVRQLFFTHVKK